MADIDMAQCHARSEDQVVEDVGKQKVQERQTSRPLRPGAPAQGRAGYRDQREPLDVRAFCSARVSRSTAA